MSYPINYPTPQGANIQYFYAGGQTDWVKPQGASFVWFTLIGAGGGGDGSTTGGGSGAVTNCMVPAFLIPDSLQISVGLGGAVGANGGQTSVQYYNKAQYVLLTANGGAVTGSAGTASTSNFFSCMGFFQSIAGQNGTGSNNTASATTFLSGGSGNGLATSANYGYSTDAVVGNGFFQMQPIIVGVGSGGSSQTGQGGIGCGGVLNGAGGNGLVVIITW